MTDKEDKEFQIGCHKHRLYNEITLQATHLGKTHPNLFATQALSYECLPQEKIDAIEEGSISDTIASAASIITYEISEAMNGTAPEKRPHILNAVETALSFMSYLNSFRTEEALNLSEALAQEEAKKIVQQTIKQRASSAGKASKKPYIAEKRRALARYQELIQLPNFKKAFRSVVARKIASESGFTTTPRTIEGWIKEFQSTSK